VVVLASGLDVVFELIEFTPKAMGQAGTGGPAVRSSCGMPHSILCESAHPVSVFRPALKNITPGVLPSAIKTCSTAVMVCQLSCGTPSP
jgi:hypothetical protein